MCLLAETPEPTAPKIIVPLELVQADFIDLKLVDYVETLPDEEFKTHYKLRKNLPFWLKSFVSDKVEPKCYFLNEDTNQKHLKIFLKAGRVFIHKYFKKEIDN